MKKSLPPAVNIDDQAGHFIRRMQQIAVAIFLQETQVHGVTPVQYAALQTVQNSPGMDQRTLARTIGLDTSIVAGVIDRLEARGLLLRNASPDDRRVRQLSLTDEAHVLLRDVLPSVLKASALTLEPLSQDDRHEFMRLLRLLVTENNGLSRAPRDLGLRSD